jgi:rhodanese-related sulfurtransferase
METQKLVKEICPTTTQEWIRNGAMLVDVRERNEVAQLAFDVPSIMHIPLSDFEERYVELPTDCDLVTVCRGGGRSLRAAGFLVNHGYTRVANMQHGMNRWAQKGFPTKGDVSAFLNPNAHIVCCGTSPAKTTDTSCCSSSSDSDGSTCC